MNAITSDGQRGWSDTLWAVTLEQGYDWIHSCYVCFGLAGTDTYVVTFKVTCCGEFFVIYACIYVSKYKPWECVADPNLPYLTLVVLVHVAWCELEDQIAILSTTNYWAIPMSWVCLLCHGSGSLRFKALTGQSWVCLVCTAMVQEIWGSKGEKEHVVTRMSFLQFPSK